MEFILVTGGAGFIGSHLCDHFIKKGHKVRCLDDLSSGAIRNIEHLMEHDNFELIQGNINSYETCLEVVNGVDFICHQAAIGSVPRSIDKPLPTHDANATGFLHILNAAREHGVNRMIYASSSSVYGSDTHLPKKEEFIGDPLSPYAVSKKMNEVYANLYQNLFGISIVGLRYFNVFGPRQSPKGNYAAVIPNFVSKLLNLESPIIHGEGDQLRDFTYVENVVLANELAMQATKSSNKHQVFNVACGEQTTINELFELIKGILSNDNKEISKVSAQYVESRKGDIKRSFADISSITNGLGYTPKVKLKEGLEKMLSDVIVYS